MRLRGVPAELKKDAPLLGFTPWEIDAWEISTPLGEDRAFRRDMLSRVPERFARGLMRTYRATHNAAGRVAANRELLDAVETLDSAGPAALRIAASNDTIRKKANRLAGLCMRAGTRASRHQGGVGKAYEAMASIAQDAGVSPPTPGDRISVEGAIRRLQDDRWWRRALRKAVGRKAEHGAIAAGLVHRRAERYASDDAVARRAEQKRRNRDVLATLEAINELGESYSLDELVAASVANPRVRRSELMARMAGFEQVARASGHAAEFHTLTCPSRFHARLSRTGERNPRYASTTPREAQGYLRSLWARVRSKLQRLGIGVYGFRIAEPHADGTPHWHFLLFMEPGHIQTVRAVIREYAMHEDGNEPGAAEHRFTAVAIDYRRGTATGYIAKYVSKNIDGHGLDAAPGQPGPASVAERVDAWASTWGIRQFQQIGGPPVTVWRELRRLNPKGVEGVLKDAAEAADAGNWAEFTRLMGGPTAERSEHPMRLHKIWSDEPGTYGEPIGDRTIGVAAGVVTAVTRVHLWKIEPCRPRAEKPACRLRDDALSSPPWSPVNNCTDRCVG